MIGLYTIFLLICSVKGYNVTTPKPSPYYHLRLVTPKSVIEGKVNS
jgi:hypothetical protein